MSHISVSLNCFPAVICHADTIRNISTHVASEDDFGNFSDFIEFARDEASKCNEDIYIGGINRTE